VRVRAGTVCKGSRRTLYIRVKPGTVHERALYIRVRAVTVRRGGVTAEMSRRGNGRTLWVRVRAGTVRKGSRTSLWVTLWVILCL
jgi:hypothetical protein